MSNDISFNGAFLINYKKAIPNLQESFEKVANEYGSKQIFRNFAGNKDEVLYVFRNSRDYDIAHFVQKNEMKFKYMPDVNTKMRLDPELPEEAIKKIKEFKPLVITKMKELAEYVQEHRLATRPVKNSHISHVDRILTALKIKPQVEPQTNNKTGVVKFIDKVNNGEIIISPKGENGISYIYYKPSNRYEYPSFYSVDKNGNTRTYKTPDEILEFRSASKKAVRMFQSNKKTANV